LVIKWPAKDDLPTPKHSSRFTCEDQQLKKNGELEWALRCRDWARQAKQIRKKAVEYSHQMRKSLEKNAKNCKKFAKIAKNNKKFTKIARN
jgi:hypothetical protein